MACKKIGTFIKQINEKNKDGIYEEVLGISIDKEYIPSVANTIGTDLKKYNVLKKNRFAFNPMHVGRDKKLPIALYHSDEPALISPAYNMFEVTDKSVDIRYLMLLFKTKIFDHLCWFCTDGSVRGGLTWSDFCNIELEIPDIRIQNKVVEKYSIINDRIKVLKDLNEELFYLLQTNFKYFIHSNKNLFNYSLSNFCNFQEGYVNPPQENLEYFDGNVKWLRAGDVNESYIINTERTLTEEGFKSAKKSAILFKPKTFAITKSGVIGRLGIIDDFMCGNRAVINIMPKDTKYFSFVYLILKEKQDEVIQLATGSAQKNLYVSMLESIEFEAPSLDEIKMFNDKMVNVFDKIEMNCKEIDCLEKLLKGYFQNLI